LNTADVRVAKAMCEEAMDQATTYTVMYVPTTVLFKQGKAVDQFVGALPEPELRRKLDALLS
jgi:thioredoxin-like negative regulator of GroEL